MIRRITVLAVSSTLLLAVAACSGGGGDQTASHTNPPETAVTATHSTHKPVVRSPNVAETQADKAFSGSTAPSPDNPVWANQKPFAGPAAQKYGAAHVETAYREAVSFTLMQAMNPSTLDQSKGFTAETLPQVKPFLTTAAGQSYSTNVLNAETGNQEAEKEVGTLTLNNVYKRGWKFKNPPISNRSFTPGMASVDSLGRLAVNFSVSGQINTQDTDGTATHTVPFTKTVTYWMVPSRGSDGPPWLIDGWKTLYTPDKVVTS